VDDLKCSIKFQLKKVLCMGVAVAHVGMSERDIYINTQVRLSCACHAILPPVLY
jgi:large subunit ribosomal protein L10Ae